MPKTNGDIYIHIRKELKEAGIEACGMEARLILACAAGKDPAKLTIDMSLYTSEQVAQTAESYLQRRLAGEPVAYITQSWEFYGLPMIVSPDVLIPRMDTEVLVRTAVDLVRPRMSDARFLDLCTGSGCVGCAIAHEMGGSRVVMLDNSPAALSIARKNARLNRVDGRVFFIECDVMEPPPIRLGNFNCIVCNPPYIESGEIPLLDHEVRDFEPHAALDGGSDGLDFYRAILTRWKPLLRTASYMLFEVGEGQAEKVVTMMRLNGFKDVRTVEDTAGIERVVYGRN